jgi:serine/threonine-protein kinase HipA
MALKRNGKDDRLTRQDFLTLARTIDVPRARAETVMSEIAAKLGEAARGLAVPIFARRGTKTVADAIREIVVARLEPFR